jgi:hypothetical protein
LVANPAGRAELLHGLEFGLEPGQAALLPVTGQFF